MPESLISVVHVSDPQASDKFVHEDKFTPRPKGSLPIVVIPQADTTQPPIQIRQSIAIINLVELCDAGELGFPRSTYPDERLDQYR